MSGDITDANGPDWRLFDFSGTGTWPSSWPAVSYRAVADNRIAFHLQPPEIAGNRLGGLNGAFLAGLAETCLGLFLALDGRDRDSVTVSMSLDYPGSGHVGAPIEGELELMRETGRMQFVRIVLRQGDIVLLHGQGVVRKLKPA